MELPHGLAHWAALLDIFPRDIALALGPLVQRLSRAIGPFRSDMPRALGEPNGFDGLTRRGHYERLLLSEWLLAEEAPLEFSRRAVSGEHAFMKIAHLNPAAARHTLALFDAGPSQFGGPRIAQIAALIVLARRAESSGAGFLWGIAQSPQLQPQDQVTTASVLHLVKARCHIEPTSEDLLLWRERFGLERYDDAWLIGGSHLSRLAESEQWSRLRISDTYEPEAARLSVSMLRPNSATPAHSVLLDLPTDRISARILRDPFRTTAAPLTVSNHSFLPASNLCFIGGSKIVARSADQGIVVYSFPNSPRDRMTQPRSLAANYPYPILAVSRTKRQILIISQYDRRTLRIEAHHALNGDYACDFDLPVNDPATLPPLKPCWQWRDQDLLFHLPDIGLVHVNKAEKKASVIIHDIQDLVPAGNKHWYLSIPGNFRVITNVMDWNGKSRVLESIAHTERVLIGAPGGLKDDSEPLLALETGLDQWGLRGYTGDIRIDDGASVCAVIGCRARWRAPALVTLSNDRRIISIIGPTWNTALPRESSDIDQVVINPLSPELAYTTSNNELVAYSIQTAEILMRLQLSGGEK